VLLYLFPPDEQIIFQHFDVEGHSTEGVKRVIDNTIIEKLEHLISNARIPLLPVRNPRPMGQKIADFYAEEMDQNEIHMSPNFYYSHFPGYQTQSEPLDFEDPPFTSRKLDACQILLKNRKKKLLSVWVVELTVFQCFKVLDVNDDMYQIISHYRDFSLE
jgi:hypothetical protein